MILSSRRHGELIKERKRLVSDRRSSQVWWPNQYRVLLSGMVQVPWNHHPSAWPGGTQLARAAVDTIRFRLLKIGAVILCNTRRVAFLLSSGSPAPEAVLQRRRKAEVSLIKRRRRSFSNAGAKSRGQSDSTTPMRRISPIPIAKHTLESSTSLPPEPVSSRSAGKRQERDQEFQNHGNLNALTQTASWTSPWSVGCAGHASDATNLSVCRH